jgi:hypothetical protein
MASNQQISYEQSGQHVNLCWERRGWRVKERERGRQSVRDPTNRKCNLKSKRKRPLSVWRQCQKLIKYESRERERCKMGLMVWFLFLYFKKQKKRYCNKWRISHDSCEREFASKSRSTPKECDLHLNFVQFPKRITVQVFGEQQRQWS